MEHGKVKKNSFNKIKEAESFDEQLEQSNTKYKTNMTYKVSSIYMYKDCSVKTDVRSVTCYFWL